MKEFARRPLRYRYTSGPLPSLARQCARVPRLRSLRGLLVAHAIAPAPGAIVPVLRVLWRYRVPIQRSSAQAPHAASQRMARRIQPGFRIAFAFRLARAMLLATHTSRMPLPSSGELFDLFQE